ncbi:MAG TPA: 3-oxoadipate enol-lactonase [Solirubrobacteraceae bacterium]|nr:3-oxoadipate enol-lactonase [Solirubrobacteraceae bacterium]
MSSLNHLLSGPEETPVLVLGSSLGTTLSMWDPELEALGRRHRLLRFDHRGHGGSPAPPGPWEIADLGRDVLELLDSLGLARVSYAGVSLGGMVGMWLAANAPERIERLVIVCSSAHLPPAQAWAQRAEAVIAAGSVGAVSATVLERWFTPAFAKERPEVMSWMDAMLRACPPVGYAGCCGVIERLDLRDQLSAITAPTLVIAAAEDPSTPPEHSELIAAAIPAAALEVLEHGAHLVAVERPDEVSALIDRHLEDA